MLVCVVVGALAGVVGLLVNELFGWADSILGENAHASMFAIGFSIGYSLANILMGVVLSAVDSVIVCFAEAPGELATLPLSTLALNRAHFRVLFLSFR